jgi:hypothetical protein
MRTRKMITYKFKIRIPDRLDAILAGPLLLYRKLRYGYTFRRIPLTQGQFAKVDQIDYPRIHKYKWRAQKTVWSYNAVRVKTIKNKIIIIYMHREILPGRDGLVVDHINNDGLDNRRVNLRLATIAENNQNRRGPTGKSSRYKGVAWDNRGKRWRARISANKKIILLGSFKSEIEAAKAYDAAARKYHGRFASPNFPSDPSGQ